ncbi:Glucose 1-dehydrogenase B [Pseudoalteromonas sp. THAF3]|nr:SDR family NAD(P)-dependent oxidoreductase [Pseudoalteromonas sp. CNAT2-18.1]QFU04315.1 Glucose 1-dehydrogenase B [Pseudoalteromonas sp. THAF3]|tara:strand:- start:1031 stop:1273 length:243 start_codon:yes stop_codon:yes gene_type:complete
MHQNGVVGKRKVALIIGSSQGVGAKAAVRLVDEGFPIVLNHRESDILKQEVVQKGSECIAVQADVSQEHMSQNCLMPSTK